VRITSVETIPVLVPIKPELAIKSGRGGSHATSPFLLMKVHTDAGLVGLGEASCTPPRPERIASSGLIGTRTGIVSTAVIFTAESPLAHCEPLALC